MSKENKAAQSEEWAKRENHQLQAIDFSTFVFSLSTAAQFQLGDARDPETGKQEANLPMAKQTIDILGILEEKTKGNLTEAEANLLDNLLYTLRMRYIEKSKS
ncbi:MAG: DUF1844 domain-containing protein [Proteobacteria bacterium]|nr:DUF1844 domain-containing protein [Pseudomonadota bacterium]